MPTAHRKSPPAGPTAYEAGKRKLIQAIGGASLDHLILTLPEEVAKLLGAHRVRVFRRDPLTDELYARFKEAGKMREVRQPSDPSSVTGYAAMTRKNSFAWKTAGDGEKRYIVAIPMTSGDGILGVVELTHGIPNVAVDEERLKVLHDLVGHMAKQLEDLVKVTTRNTPYDYLFKTRRLTDAILKAAREKGAQTNHSTEHVLLTEQKIPKEDLGKSLSEHFECPFCPSPKDLSASPDLLRRFPRDFLRSHALLPVNWKGDAIEIVVVNPRNLALLDDVKRLVETDKVIMSVSVREDILAALEKLLPAAPPPAAPSAPDAPAAAGGDYSDVALEVETSYSLADAEKVEIDSSTIRLVNETIQAAIDQGASDIHYEPTPTGGLHIRFRMDGICHDYKTVPQAIAKPVVSRIKIMAQLDIAEHRLPQDGKIRLKDKRGRKTDLRVAVMPTQGGFEDVVLRILAESTALKLDQIGMDTEVLQRFKTVVGQPHGIVLCVGPTGAGKTTTLHAALAHLKNGELKLWTAEDPVEITQEGVRQVQVLPKIGFTFERALRSFLRCDPDIIMIGEIRDKETASAAIEASLTGHLVLSTLHTNSAPETVTRLLEMGLDPFAFADSLLGVLAQRLVRAICPGCREAVQPTQETFQELRQQYGDGGAFDALRMDRKKLALSRGKGCDKCYNTGYKGRLGIHELLVVTPEVRQIVRKKGQSDAIKAAAVESGMITLKQDGIRKVLQGKTDLKEVLSTTIEENL